MTLDELNAININNPAAVKELQQFLKAQGYYAGPIDGKWGGGTTEGAVKLRTDLTTAANTNRDTAIANQQANDPTNNAIRGATEIGPYAVGVGTGAVVGHVGAKALKGQDAAQRAAVHDIATNPKISSEAARGQLRSMRTSRNAVTGAQFGAPALFLGSAEYLRRGVAPNFEGPDGKDTETSKWIKLGANLDQGIGLGVLGHQLVDLKNRIRSPNAPVDEALIASRPPTPPAPPPDAPAAPPTLRTPADRLTAAARAAGATGKLNKKTAAEYLAANVNAENRAAVATELGVGPGQKITTAIKKLSTSRKPSALFGPLIAGGVAYDAASSDAEAAGATPGEARTQGAVAGTGAAAATGGAVYGLNKLAQAVPPIARNALSVAGGMMTPLAAMDMGPDTPEAANRERSRLAVNYPGMAPMFGLTDEMGQQLPTRAPVKDDEFATSRALQIPEGIPLPQPPNALAAAGQQEDAFGRALKEFMAFVQEQQGAQEGAPQ